MVELLLDLGADPNRRSDWEMGPWSPMDCAVAKGHTALAERLLERGATLDTLGAAGLGRVDDLRRMLDADPQAVHARGGDGCQPLHFAHSTEIVDLLLERGADIDARCVDHYSTPVQYLAESQPAIARYLFQRGAAPDIFSASLAGDIETVDRLLDEAPSLLNARIDQSFFPPGPDHDVHNMMTFSVGHHATPLHAAARGNHPELVRMLVGRGMSPDVRGGYDDATPLHLAAWNNLAEAATALVDAGADINARSGRIHNNAPAGWAIVAGSADVFELLLDRGAEILEWFADDVKDALAGRFAAVSQGTPEKYARMQRTLDRRKT
jgi:ankyrin repeat protein